MGNLLEAARSDWKRFTGGGGFEVELTFISPASDEVTVNGLGTKHHLQFGSSGEAINAKNTHCSVHEDYLTAAGYPVRNASGEVSMRKHQVKFKDSTGLEKNYSIDQAWPDETVGMLVFTLGDHV